MEEIDEWIVSVQSVLMFGLESGTSDTAAGKVSDEDPSQQHLRDLKGIKQVLEELLVRSSQFKEGNANESARIVSLYEKIDSLAVEEDGTVIMGKVEKYMKLKLKIQHMCLVKTMYELKHYRVPKDIPALIFAVRDDVPGVLLGHSKIKRVVVETVNHVKAPLLAQFHKLLDEHMVAAQQDSSMQMNTSGKAERENTQWTDFVRQARDSLLAFTMVNMLPTVLTETSGMILEKFQDTLDEALTPTWGRYHYHLQVARKAKSSQQIMWTFDYTRSFVRMMCDLSLALTSSVELQRLSPLDYATAGQKQVLDKAGKFMRAHLAQIVVDFSPMSREMCMQLVEETLELDEWIHSIAALTRIGETGNMRVFAPLSIGEVLYDAKEVFHQWLHIEHRFFHFELRGKCRDVKKVFVFEFGDDSPTAIGGNGSTGGAGASGGTGAGGGNSKVGDALHMTKLRCYAGVYDCMTTFFTACERYQHLPPTAQRVFSVCILEPLLCTALGLLLYRTRSNAVLYHISMGTYKTGLLKTRKPPKSKDSSNNPSAGTAEVPQELVEFIDSACYLQSCLGASAHRKLASRSAAQFRTSLWSELQTWMPQILISEEDAKKGFSAVDLVDKAWKLPQEYSADSTYSYRNPSSAGAVGSGKGGAVPGRSPGRPELCELGECVDVARGLAITLCNVLKQQLSICK